MEKVHAGVLHRFSAGPVSAPRSAHHVARSAFPSTGMEMQYSRQQIRYFIFTRPAGRFNGGSLQRGSRHDVIALAYEDRDMKATRKSGFLL